MTPRAVTATITLACLTATLIAGCGEVGDPSAQYFPRLAAEPQGVAAPAVSQVHAVKLSKVSRPDPRYTPGAVALTDVVAVCALPRKPPPVSPAEMAAVFQRYGFTQPPGQLAKRFQIDYLVPLQLGGAATLDNMWPASLRGIGYHDKQVLNARLRVRVCHGEVPLAQVQRLIVFDWYSLFLEYGT